MREYLLYAELYLSSKISNIQPRYWAEEKINYSKTKITINGIDLYRSSYGGYVTNALLAPSWMLNSAFCPEETHVKRFNEICEQF